MSDKVQCNIHKITIEPKYECHLCRENREYQEDKEERDRVLGGESEATMTDNEIKDKILYILTWLTGEKTILTNSLQKNEIDEHEYMMGMNNAIARAVTEIKELL